jgi:hypothetical protein
MDCKHVVVVVNEDKLLMFSDIKPPCFVVVVGFGYCFDSFVQRADVVSAEAVIDFWTVHSDFDFSGYKCIQLIGRSNALPKVFDVSRCSRLSRCALGCKRTLTKKHKQSYFSCGGSGSSL